MKRRVSIVVNTFNRAPSLRVALRSLRQLEHTEVEVVVVNGPSTDETEEVLAEFDGAIKVGRTPNRNLSESRNLGIALAAGEIVAFLDDDAYPDPAWIGDLLGGFDDDLVAGVGGPLYDHTGARFQVRHSIVDRFGANQDLTYDPTPYLNRPKSLWIGALVGANSSFRRDRLVELGGFDEVFEYFLDESDVCFRMVDRGWLIRQLDSGFVYHKFLPSDVRTQDRVVSSYHSIVKNSVYFALKHAYPTYSFRLLCQRLLENVELFRGQRRYAVAQGWLSPATLEEFDREVDAAFDLGLRTFLDGSPRHRPPEFFAEPPPFLRFATKQPASSRLHVCLFSQEWPPQRLSGIGRFITSLAGGLAAEGHLVRVLTRGDHVTRVDLEDGVWVHRVPVVAQSQPRGDALPARLWDYSASLLAELRRVAAQRPVDVVHAPNWDSEGIAVLVDGGFKTAVWLHTPLRTVRAIDPHLSDDARLLDRMERAERRCYELADRLLASGPSVVREIEQRYGLRISSDRVGFVPHGLPDLVQPAPPRHGPGHIRVLFVGRLEPRKGIDTLLECVPDLCSTFPDLGFTIVGPEVHSGSDSIEERFLRSPAAPEVRSRIQFTGAVDDGTLLGHYAGCDLFVAPSRWESFGLTVLEAMRAGKPVIVSRVGGMSDLVEEGGNGYAVAPGDPAELKAAISRLAASSDARAAFGKRSRELFLARFTQAHMVRGMVAEYRILASSALS